MNNNSKGATPSKFNKNQASASRHYDTISTMVTPQKPELWAPLSGGTAKLDDNGLWNMKFFDPLITAERCERKTTFKVRFPMSFKKTQNEERIALIDKLFKDPLSEAKTEESTCEKTSNRKRDLKFEEKEKCPSPVSEKVISSVTKSSSENSVDVDTEVSVVKQHKVIKQAKQFDFFFLRTCFRTMNEFFKTEYIEYFRTLDPDLQKQSLTSISRGEIEGAVSGYIDKMFGPSLMSNDVLNKGQKSKMIQSMITFVYAHRHNKEDLFLVDIKKERYLDFSILRDCMYHYSRKAQDRFFSHPIEAYFFARFAASPDGQNFIKAKQNMTPDNIAKLLKYTQSLKELTIRNLGNPGHIQVQGSEDPILCQFLLDDLKQLTN